MKEDSKYSLSLTYGLREDQTLKQLEQLSKEKILPQSRNEILRRSLHAGRYLAEVDDSFLIMLLSRLLHSANQNFFPITLKFAKDLAFTIFAVQIMKHGINKAETFDTIPMTLQTFEQVLREKGFTPQIEEGIKKSVGDLAISVDTVFLKPLIEKDEKVGLAYGGLLTTLLTNSIESDRFFDTILGKKKALQHKRYNNLEQARESLRNKKKIKEKSL